MQNDIFSMYRQEAGNIHKKWGLFLGFGLVLALLGLFMISTAWATTLFSVVLFGCMLVTVGIIQLAQALVTHSWHGLFISLLLAILYFVTGALCISKPTIAAVDLTLLIAAVCFIGGLFRIMASLIIRFKTWEWVFFNGIITCLLGVLIFAEWPLSSLWVIGTFVGIDVLLSGSSWLAVALYAKNHKA